MPYITKTQREELETRGAQTAGEVNYLVTLLMNSYFTNYQSANDIAECIDFAIDYIKTDRKFELGSELGKQLLDIVGKADVRRGDVVGALRNAHLEFYIRKVRPYEDKKIEENGDVGNETQPV